MDLGKLFLEHRKMDIGVEIGVQNGFNLKQITEFWNGLVIGVDHWANMAEYEKAKEILQYRAVLLKGDSIRIGNQFTDESLDWIHIDAGHSYEEVKADFDTWYPKVRTGGVISFHDYGVNDCIGVKIFIDEYMRNHPDIRFSFTTEDFWRDVEYQTVWFIKPYSNINPMKPNVNS